MHYLVKCKCQETTDNLKPNCGGGLSPQSNAESVHDFVSLVYCFIVLLCVCLVSLI